MARRMVRDMGRPARRTSQVTIGERVVDFAVEWRVEDVRWLGTLEVKEPSAKPWTFPTSVVLDNTVAGEALLFTGITVADLKRWAEDSLFQQGEEFLRRRPAAD
ncbi:MAG: hypothetical protein HY329_02070 [Chloroflexi bacterium]|nr:hypothetical protein [Chloroflexota bacterium]